MPRYVIERELPGAGKLTREQLHSIAMKSCQVIKELGSELQWIESYVTDNKLYCIYLSPNETLLRQHAEKGGFPANSVQQVREVISPETAESV